MSSLAQRAGEFLRARGWRLRALPRARAVAVLDARGRELGRFVAERSGAGGLRPAVALRAGEAGGGRTPVLDELSSLLAPLIEERLGAAPRPGRAESHPAERGRDLIVRATFACNQRCAFCFVPRRSGYAGLEELLSGLPPAPRGRAELTISGGEPTLHPELPELLRRAREAGYRRLVLQTNAVLLADAAARERLIAAGARTFLVSFHSHRPADYDGITGTRGQFARAAAGLRGLLRDRRCAVTVNIVVNARNARSLPGLVRYLARAARGGRRPDLYFSMINEAGHLIAPAWTLSLEEARPWLRRADGAAARAGLLVARSAGESSFPPCVFEKPQTHAALRALGGVRARYAALIASDEAAGRVKALTCRSCRFDERCRGVPASYAARFGLGALKAPPRARLRQTRRVDRALRRRA